MIKHKSIYKRKHRNDGLRICVMRHIRSEYDFDLWFPKLAPSEKLLKKYIINKEISWNEFQPLYLKELSRNLVSLDLLFDIAEKNLITLLCSENTIKYCHRQIIIRVGKKRHPNVYIAK